MIEIVIKTNTKIWTNVLKVDLSTEIAIHGAQVTTFKVGCRPIIESQLGSDQNGFGPLVTHV